MYRNMLASVSCDCETVKNVVTGNSSSKPDRTGRDGKFVKQSKMLNNSAYSRLVNNQKCLITLYIVGWVIKEIVTAKTVTSFKTLLDKHLVRQCFDTCEVY